jgi:hypothetical protein
MRDFAAPGPGNLFPRHAIRHLIKHLPNHHPAAFEGWLAVTNFRIGNYVLSQFHAFLDAIYLSLHC